MITIKLPYKTTNDQLLIKEIIREQAVIRKWSYNRFKDDLKEKEIRNLIDGLNNINNIDSWFKQSSIYDGKAIYKTNGDKKVIFNSKNFKRRLKHLISKEEYRNLKNDYIYSIGEAPQKGNRKFELHIDKNTITFKPKYGIKIELELPNLRNNIKKQLIQLDLLCAEKKIAVTYKLDLKYVYIGFDETLLNQNKFNLNSELILGIDLNPNYIGCSVLKFTDNKYDVVKTFCYDLSKLTDKKGNHNKLKHETIEVTQKIINICKHYRIKYIAVENLDIKTKDNQHGKNNNSLLNNKWLRSLFDQQLSKRCRNFGINYLTVYPYYTSIIGNLQHDYFDPINASIEIARRAYEIIILKNKQFYPKFEIKALLRDQWKEYLNVVLEWKKLFLTIKNLKLRYRVSLDQTNFDYNVLRMTSTKSCILLYNFV